jgi:pimeloyl-ACP methyl ester carboxylesterase
MPQRIVAVGALAIIALASFSAAQAAVLVFGDGFVIEGQVKYVKTTLVDKTNGNAIPIPKTGEPYYLDDDVRRIYFAPKQVGEAKAIEVDKTGRLVLRLPSPPKSGPLPSGFIVKEVGDWNDKLEREIKLEIFKGKLTKLTQRITTITPEYIKVETSPYESVGHWKTSEFDPAVLHDLVNKQQAKLRDRAKLADNVKEQKVLDDRYACYRLLLQAGFNDEAEKELQGIIDDHPGEKSNAEPLLDGIRRIRALEFVESLKSANKAGLHDEVERKLAQYHKESLDNLVDQKTQLVVQAIKEQQGTSKAALVKATNMLTEMLALAPSDKKELFEEIFSVIREELNPDTVGRLATFVDIGGDYQRAVKDKRQPEQGPAEIVALAITGWTRGSNAAEPNVEVAVKNWQTRQQLIKYLQTRDAQVLSALRSLIGVEEAMQMIHLLPPIFAEKLGPNLKFDFQANGKNYHVRLPAGYHHGRGWPVLLVLHSSQEKAADAAARWADLSSQHGYIVAAPQWSKGPKATYQFTGEEHEAVLETLKDLRRRFNVDSDRVYLFGLEQGATMAFDVAVGHPDQFAGVIPMSGMPQNFAVRCWHNTQYLSLYVVNGELAGDSAKATQSLVKENWIKSNFPALYVEYKGRPADWFGAEQKTIFDWMNRKRRANPLREVANEGLDFKTYRNSDKQFYWLSTDTVQSGHLNSATQWNPQIKPATLSAKVIASVNEVQVKSSGVGPITVWFGPKLVNYGEKVSLRINGKAPQRVTIVPSLDVLLSTLFQTGDRERLYFARVELKP